MNSLQVFYFDLLLSGRDEARPSTIRNIATILHSYCHGGRRFVAAAEPNRAK